MHLYVENGEALALGRFRRGCTFDSDMPKRTYDMADALVFERYLATIVLHERAGYYRFSAIARFEYGICKCAGYK